MAVGTGFGQRARAQLEPEAETECLASTNYKSNAGAKFQSSGKI